MLRSVWATVGGIVVFTTQLFGQAPAFEPLRFGDPVDTERIPWFANADPDPSIPVAEEVLGQTLGTRLSRHSEILECFRRWDEASDRLVLRNHGVTHEGRPLIHAVITSPDNQERLEEILTNLGRLADPEGLEEAEANALIDATPASAWLGYSIHGDELSGCDAALALTHHLVADRSEPVLELLDQLVIVVDPCMNPDGRQRILTMVEQGAGTVPNLDYASMQRGRWPWGRGNHYLFDMNRDWLVGTQPETRGRWSAARQYHPQLFVDAHEMGSLDTFLFYPQNQPHNPFLPATLDGWHQKFGNDQAAAFDSYGWGYYTREWADGWGPYYSDAWGSLQGAIGILYEQASTSGFALRRQSGEILTYREAVHHQVVSSWANLTTLATHRKDVLRDFWKGRRHNSSADAPGNDRMFVLVPGRHPERERELFSLLRQQGVRIFETTESWQGNAARNTLGETADSVEFPAGSWVIRTRQPQSPLIKSALTFDVRLGKAALLHERKELEQKGQTTLYDATAWSLPLAFDLNAYWCEDQEIDGNPLETLTPPGSAAPSPSGDDPTYAWAMTSQSDGLLPFAVAAMEQDLSVHISDREFAFAGQVLPRGSLLIRRHENERSGRDAAEVARRVQRAASTSGAKLLSQTTGRSPDEGPDLGGGHFRLLERPRVALLGNSPVAPDTYGHLWHHLDQELRIPLSQLDAQSFSSTDLRRYNVLVLPPAWGLDGFLSQHRSKIEDWVRQGGTLVACGNAAAALCQTEEPLTSVVLRRHALEELEQYESAAQRELDSREVELDENLVWQGIASPERGTNPQDEEPKPQDDSSVAETTAHPNPDQEDTWRQRFSPSGAFLKGLVNELSWITAGCEPQMPVPVAGSSVFLARTPVRTAIRLAPSDELRVSGLLWPEARWRLERSAYLTLESLGRGQVILFSTPPAYRGQMRATARLFGNAVVLGPGLGAQPARGW